MGGGGSSICPDGSHISCFGALMLAPPSADNNNNNKKIDSVGTQSQVLEVAKAFHKRDNVRRSEAKLHCWWRDHSVGPR